jgi:hypothetical protein
VCGSYIASGAGVCDGLRVPTPFLDNAVVDGIKKRIEKVLDREGLTIRLRELLGAEEGHGPSREDLEARLAETGRKIDRLVDALAAGGDNLPRQDDFRGERLTSSSTRVSLVRPEPPRALGTIASLEVSHGSV